MVVGFDTLELKVEEVFGIEGTLFLNLLRRDACSGLVKVKISGQTDNT